MKFDVLHNFISPITGRLPLIEDYILIGDNQNFSIASPKLIDIELKLIDIQHEFDNIESSSFIIGFPKDIFPHAQVLSVLDDGFMFNTAGIVSTLNLIPITALPDLTFKHVWKGDIFSRPQEVLLDFAPDNAAYILQQPNTSLPNAQGLNLLGGGILKTTLLSNGEISIASSGKIPETNDYISPLDLIEEIHATISECNAFATAEALAAESGAIASGIAYFTTQMLPYSLLPLVPAGISISGAIAVVEALVASAQSSANNANNRISNLTAIGDVIGGNNGSDQIITVFAPNPKFTGNEAMKIPYGTTSQRPGNPSVGMIRYNTDL